MRFQNEEDAGEAIAERAERLMEARSAQYVVDVLDVALKKVQTKEGEPTSNRRQEPRSNVGPIFDGHLEPGSAAARRFEAAGGTIQDRD